MKIFFLLFIIPFSAIATDEKKVFTVGVTAPFTGDFASYGEKVRRGVDFAKSDLEKRNIYLNIKYEDACLPAAALSAINKLVQIDKIQGLAANFCVIAMPAMANTIQSKHIPTIHSAITTESISSLGGYIFTTDIKVRTEAEKLAEYAFKVLKAKTAGILNIETDFGIDYKKYFTKRFEEMGGKVLFSESQPIGVNDFKAELTLLKSKTPDVILAAHLGLSLGNMLKQARQIGMKNQFLGTNESEDQSVRDVAQEGSDGLIFYVPEIKSKSEKVKEFDNRYFEKFKQSAGLVESSSYDSTTILGEALHACNAEPVCSKTFISNIKIYDGMSGKFSPAHDGAGAREFVLKKIENANVKIISE